MKELLALSNPSYGFSSTPFGNCCIAFSNNGICALTFHENQDSACNDLARRFPSVNFTRNDEKATQLANQIFEKKQHPVLHLIGTNFQQSIWQALLKVPNGKTATYAQIATAIGRPKAVRAVGTAVGANPIAYLIPCHRIIRTDGSLGGFRWGVDCKMKMLEYEKNY